MGWQLLVFQAYWKTENICKDNCVIVCVVAGLVSRCLLIQCTVRVPRLPGNVSNGYYFFVLHSFSSLMEVPVSQYWDSFGVLRIQQGTIHAAIISAESGRQAEIQDCRVGNRCLLLERANHNHSGGLPRPHAFRDGLHPTSTNKTAARSLRPGLL